MGHRSGGRTAPGIMARLKSFFKPDKAKQAAEAKKRKKADRQRRSTKGWGRHGATIRTSHVASRRYQRIGDQRQTKT